MLYYFERAVIGTWMGISRWLENVKTIPEVLYNDGKQLESENHELREVRVSQPCVDEAADRAADSAV